VRPKLGLPGKDLETELEAVMRAIDAQGSLTAGSGWITFNSREMGLLRRFHSLLQISIQWLSLVLFGEIRLKSPAADRSCVDYVNRMLEMAIDLVGNHARYE
jgi:hypothetical protein